MVEWKKFVSYAENKHFSTVKKFLRTKLFEQKSIQGFDFWNLRYFSLYCCFPIVDITITKLIFVCNLFFSVAAPIRISGVTGKYTSSSCKVQNYIFF